MVDSLGRIRLVITFAVIFCEDLIEKFGFELFLLDDPFGEFLIIANLLVS